MLNTHNLTPFLKLNYITIFILNCIYSKIAAAFRKKAIKLHPDRNKATNAGDQFIKLNQSFKLLADPVYREKMNKVLKAKKIREQKFKEMSAKRQNLKTSLEKAEKQFENANDQKKSELNKTKLDEMRKENIELLKKHNDEQKGTKPLKNTKPDKIFHFGIKLAVEKSAEQVELNKSIAKSLINQVIIFPLPKSPFLQV